MTNTQLLIGSLSNDLFRVAELTQRGSHTAALRFLKEAQRWSVPLEKTNVADYILKIAKNVSYKEGKNITLAEAEQYLMNGILLQNYALHANTK